MAAVVSMTIRAVVIVVAGGQVHMGVNRKYNPNQSAPPERKDSLSPSQEPFAVIHRLQTRMNCQRGDLQLKSSNSNSIIAACEFVRYGIFVFRNFNPFRKQ